MAVPFELDRVEIFGPSDIPTRTPSAPAPGTFQRMTQLRVDVLSNIGRGYTLHRLSGQRVYFRRSGSTPGVRLNLRLGGREFLAVAPGTRITIPFDTIEVAPSALSVGGPNAQVAPSVGQGNAPLALLEIMGSTDIDFEEDTEGVYPSAPIDLLGKASLSSAQLATYIELPKDSPPGNTLDWDVYWDVTGWKRLRVFLDGGASNVLTECTLIPWFSTNGFTDGWENGGAPVTIPDTRTTGYRYRTFTYELAPLLAPSVFGVLPPIEQLPTPDPTREPVRWYMSFELRDLLPANATVGIAVQGID